VRFAVRYINSAGAAHENAVWARQAALARGAIGSIAALAGADYRRDDSRLQVDSPDGVALGIGQIKAVAGSPRDALWPRKPRQFGRAAIAIVAGLARPPNVENLARLRVHPVHRSAFAQHQVQVAIGSTVIARGPFSGVPAMGAPSGVGLRWPVPAQVSIVPVSRSTRRIRWLPMSQIKRRPCRSNAMLCGWRSCALAAGPPSPLKPAAPVPAIVVTCVLASTRRTTWFCLSAKNMLPLPSKRTS